MKWTQIWDRTSPDYVKYHWINPTIAGRLHSSLTCHFQSVRSMQECKSPSSCNKWSSHRGSVSLRSKSWRWVGSRLSRFRGLIKQLEELGLENPIFLRLPGLMLRSKLHPIDLQYLHLTIHHDVNSPIYLQQRVELCQSLHANLQQRAETHMTTNGIWFQAWIGSGCNKTHPCSWVEHSMLNNRCSVEFLKPSQCINMIRLITMILFLL